MTGKSVTRPRLRGVVRCAAQLKMPKMRHLIQIAARHLCQRCHMIHDCLPSCAATDHLPALGDLFLGAYSAYFALQEPRLEVT
jgi:hypothetical protein